MVISYSLKHQARALTAVPSVKDRTLWLAGTNGLRDENEVHLITLDQDREQLKCVQSFQHVPEIWDISPCHQDRTCFLTVHSSDKAADGVRCASVWRCSDDTSKLDRVAHLRSASAAAINRAAWHASNAAAIATVEDDTVRVWRLADAAAQEVGACGADDLQQYSMAAWQPQHVNVFAAACGTSVQVFDDRTMKCETSIADAHTLAVRCIHFAPSDARFVASCGDDCHVRIWDTRAIGKGSNALVTLQGHSHWVWQVQFNDEHAQLLASAASDAFTHLWYCPSLSPSGHHAQPTHNESPSSSPSRTAQSWDGRVASYDQHEDSVYAVAWSAANPWLFASLSYDGHIVAHEVPSAVKYKLLL